jgi:flagellar biosynthesis protein FlhF
MKLKTYFSGTVEAAMELAGKELGEDALLIHSRPATRETRAFGAFEVVFGVPSGASGPEQSLPGPNNQGSRSGDAARSQAALLEPDLFTIDATLGRPGAPRAIAALIGPAGAGKTTTLIKLAVQYGVALGRPVRLLSTDVYRFAAAEQLRRLASVLEIPCAIAGTPDALIRALDAPGAGELLLIDTPGFGPRELARDREDYGGLRILGSHPHVDAHLVLPCTMNPVDLRQAARRFVSFHPQKLLFTHVDEAGSFAPLIHESARCGLPVSFLSTGSEIPDDLEPATKARIAGLVRGNVSNSGKSRGATA